MTSNFRKREKEVVRNIGRPYIHPMNVRRLKRKLLTILVFALNFRTLNMEKSILSSEFLRLKILGTSLTVIRKLLLVYAFCV